MAKRNSEDGGRAHRGALGKTVHILARGGRYAVHVPLVVAGWLLATAVAATLLWLTVGLEEGLSILELAFLYVLRTILGSLLLALVVLPVAYVLPRKWREKARKLSRRQVAIAVVMCIAIVAAFVALEAVNALR